MKKMLLFSLSLLFSLFALLADSGHAQIAKETPLMMKDLPDVPGKEGLVETVALRRGEVSPAHRHNADVFVYVLEGSIITQVEGAESRTVHAGEVFYESPSDVHIASRNASTMESARLLVFFVKQKGAPATVVVGKANAAH